MSSSPDLPLGEWDTDTVCGWLLEMGLENYVADARRWVKNGKHLAGASNHDLDKELGMKVRYFLKIVTRRNLNFDPFSECISQKEAAVVDSSGGQFESVPSGHPAPFKGSLP